MRVIAMFGLLLAAVTVALLVLAGVVSGIAHDVRLLAENRQAWWLLWFPAALLTFWVLRALVVLPIEVADWYRERRANQEDSSHRACRGSGAHR